MPRLLVGKLTHVALRVNIDKRRWWKTVALLDAQTTLGRQMDFVSIGSIGNAHTRICGEHFETSWLGWLWGLPTASYIQNNTTHHTHIVEHLPLYTPSIYYQVCRYVCPYKHTLRYEVHVYIVMHVHPSQPFKVGTIAFQYKRLQRNNAFPLTVRMWCFVLSTSVLPYYFQSYTPIKPFHGYFNH